MGGALWAFLARPQEEIPSMVPLGDAIPLDSLIYEVKVASSGDIIAVAGSLGSKGQVQVFSSSPGLEVVYSTSIAVDFPQCCATPPLVLSQDGGLMVSGSRELVLWSAASQAVNISQPALDGQTPLDMALDETAGILAAASSDRRLHVFDLRGMKCLWSVGMADGWWADVDISPQGRLALNSGSEVQLFDPSSPKPLEVWDIDGGYVVPAVAVSTGGKEVAVSQGGYHAGSIVYLRAGERNPLWTHSLGEGGYPLLAMRRQGGVAVVVKDEGAVLALGKEGDLLWRREYRELAMDAEFVGDSMVVLALKNRVRAIALDNGREVAELQIEGLPIAVSSNGRIVALVHSPTGGFGDKKYLGLYIIPTKGESPPPEKAGISGGHASWDIPMISFSSVPRNRLDTPFRSFSGF